MIRSRVNQKLSAIKAMKHQELSLKHDETHPEVFDMSDPGTGKTFVRIMGYAQRRAKKKAGKLLVLAPRSLLKAAWLADFKKFAPHLKVSVASAENREKAFAEEADVYITNHDATTWLAKQKIAFWKDFTDLVLDESPAYKHHTSMRSKAAAKIAKRFDRRAALTATPTSNGICDIWHQVFLLDQGKRLGNSYYAFRNTVCSPESKSRINKHAVEWKDKEGAEEAVYSLLEDITIRHEFEKCVDIPPTHTHTLTYQMTPRQQTMYDQMEQDQLLPLLGSITDQVTASLKGKNPRVIAVQAAAVVTKLLQIASGAVYDSTGGYSVIDTSRYSMLMDLAEVRKHPLMFFYWKHQLDLLGQEADRRGMNWAVINGDTKDDERAAIVQIYQAGGYDVLFAHPQSAAHGLTFTRGNSTIWTGPTYNLEWFKQGSRRQARIGQKQKTEIVTVLAEGTREVEIYDWVLMPKASRMANLLKLAAEGMDYKELEAA